MKPYQYDSLKSDAQEIRLLRLLPGSREAEIEIEILHESLIPGPSVPEYEALSYVWGSPSRSHHLKVVKSILASISEVDATHIEDDESRELAITQNLHIALCHLRNPINTRIMWIDGICINQDDVAERSTEVSRMAAIFSLARQVVFWLGPEYDNSTLALNTLGSLGQKVRFSPLDNRLEYGYDIEHFQNEGVESWEEKRVILVAIRDLLDRDWFERLWIFQEMKLAVKGIVTCGYCKLDWDKFKRGVHWIYSVNRLSENAAKSLNYIRLLHTKSLLIILDTLPDPETLLRVSRNLSCFDQRDRIYALLGFECLLKPWFKVEPDYSRSVEEVYKDFTLQCIKNSDRLTILEFCHFKSPIDNSLPSWVPDFASKIRDHIQEQGASGNSHHEASFSEDDSLFIRGLHLGTVESTESPFICSPNHSDTAVIIKCCMEWSPLDTLGSLYAGGGSTMDAFVTTLMQGVIKEDTGTSGGPSLAECREAFEKNLRQTQKPEWSMEVPFESRWCLQNLEGKSFFRTTDGYFGLSPPAAKSGDQIVIVLGLDWPVLVRPIQGHLNGYYLIGRCYMQGMMWGEALLGSLPKGWERKYKIFLGMNVIFFQFNDEPETQHDPRLGSLPSNWTYRYGEFENSTDHEIDEDGTYRLLFFENVETGCQTWSDPRLTSTELRKKGLDIKDFKII